MVSPKNVIATGDVIGEGDCSLVEDFLPPDLAEDAFERVRDEVEWHRMVHRGAQPNLFQAALVDTRPS